MEANDVIDKLEVDYILVSTSHQVITNTIHVPSRDHLKLVLSGVNNFAVKNLFSLSSTHGNVIHTKKGVPI